MNKTKTAQVMDRDEDVKMWEERVKTEGRLKENCRENESLSFLAI